MFFAHLFPRFCKVFPVCLNEFRNVMLLGSEYLTMLLQFMHRAQFHKHVYDFCSWMIERTRRQRLWTLCQPDTNRVGVWCVALGRETLVNWITSHVAFVIVQRTRFLGIPHASRGRSPSPPHTHTPRIVPYILFSHLRTLLCLGTGSRQWLYWSLVSEPVTNTRPAFLLCEPDVQGIPADSMKFRL